MNKLYTKIRREIADAIRNHNTKEFLDYVNKKREELGMHNTYFYTPDGSGTRNYSTVEDLFLLGEQVIKNQIITSIWSQREDTITISGQDKSIKAQMLSMADPEILPYKMTGGKSGTWFSTNGFYKVLVAKCEDREENSILLSMAVNDKYWQKNFYKAVKSLMDYLQTGKKSKELLDFETAGGSYSASDGDEILSHEKQKKIVPASTTKLITTLCVLEILSPDEKIKIKKCDLRGGSGDNYKSGDIISVKDAIKLLYLESSNTMAYALARIAGKRIR